VHERHHQAIIQAKGDDTIRTTVVDIARQLPWARGFTARVRRNASEARAWSLMSSFLANSDSLKKLTPRLPSATCDD
jgi:hypothetical protein